jgi:hypothetical protein
MKPTSAEHVLTKSFLSGCADEHTDEHATLQVKPNTIPADTSRKLRKKGGAHAKQKRRHHYLRDVNSLALRLGEFLSQNIAERVCHSKAQAMYRG